MKYFSLIIILVFISCKSTSKTPAEDHVLTEKYWKLIELNGSHITADSTMVREPHVIFRKAENKFNGNTGCNTMSGTYDFKEMERITLSKIITTKMACMSTMQLESQFLSALQMADNYNITGDTLILNKARMAPLARFLVVYLK